MGPRSLSHDTLSCSCSLTRVLPRCSPKHVWHMLMWIEKHGQGPNNDPANWRERAGKTNEVSDGAQLIDETEPTP